MKKSRFTEEQISMALRQVEAGMPGDDYVGCVSGQLGVNGNISQERTFRDAKSGSLGLDSASPCAPKRAAAECGLIVVFG